jgi:hypothetical protein
VRTEQALLRSRPALFLAAAALTLLCGAAPTDWHRQITDRDRTRLHDWRGAWVAALAHARAGGAGDSIAAEGALLMPDAAIDGPPPPDGEYRCRVIKLGAQGSSGLEFVSYPGFRCRISKGRFMKLDGSQRPSGHLYPFDGGRTLFMGAMALGDEAGAMQYGRDPDRDMVGVLEKIGPRRWRLVLPYPRWESLLDVVDLVPMGN